MISKASFKSNVNTDLNNTVKNLKSVTDSIKAEKDAQKEQFNATKQ